MPIKVFGNSSSSHDNGNKIDTSIVQKPQFRTNFIESNIDEDIDLKNQFRIKNSPDPIGIRKSASKNYVDRRLNDPSIIRNKTHVDFDDKNLDNVRLVKINSVPAVREHLAPQYYVD